MGLLRNIILSILTFTCFPGIIHAQESTEYERSSLHLMMIKHLNYRFSEEVESVFGEIPFPNRFNNHNLGVYSVSFAESNDQDQTHNTTTFVNNVNLGQKMVAKWFNRDKRTGSFNMELVKERGFYNASKTQQEIARKSLRGKAILEDAGENLIKHTYVVFNDIKYKSKGGKFSMLQSFASAYFGDAKKLQKHMEEIGGFKVSITSYLYRLVWNDDIANTFYDKYYTEDGTSEPAKVEAFKNEKNLFKMEYVGKTESEYAESKATGVKNPNELLIKICTRAIDQNLAQLQHTHQDFRIKAPLVSTEPITAYVGVKEGITSKSRFEVLERVIDEQGKVEYQQVGIIAPIEGKIWDNRYLASEEESKGLTCTTFKKISGKDFFPGMLIREISDK